jgi:hypothetical protein
MVYLRRGGWTIKLHGPWMDFVGGELRAARGGVEQVEGGRPLLDWEIAKKSVAGFVLLEELTGQPNGQIAIDGDIRVLSRETKATDERLKELVAMGKTLVRCDWKKNPMFFQELGSAVRKYEKTIFGTDETWLWGWNEFKLHLPGERYSVAFPSNSGHGLLIENDDDLRLFVDGAEVKPWEKIHGCQPRVVLPQREGGVDVVRKWNAKVHELQGSLLVQK